MSTGEICPFISSMCYGAVKFSSLAIIAAMISGDFFFAVYHVRETAYQNHAICSFSLSFYRIWIGMEAAAKRVLVCGFMILRFEGIVMLFEN